VGIEREDLQNSDHNAGTRNPRGAGWDLLITDLTGDEDYADHDDEDVLSEFSRRRALQSGQGILVLMGTNA
jgi:hypothetical protein